MPVKVKNVFVCNECGSVQPKWLGKCPECGAWNSMVAEQIQKKPRSSAVERTRRNLVPLKQASTTSTKRLVTGITEFDRVLGGGFVSGSVVLIGGEPGIGKSTLIMQVIARLPGDRLLYFSGEESEEQLALRARRLEINDDRILVACENNLENILDQIENLKPTAVVIDSIQTVYSDQFENVPGSVTQVRECAGRLLRLSKELNITTVFVGHITKDGMIAGPKVLEHLVDTVLYLEGNKNNFYRTLRAVKNRFGSTNEVGIFEMKERGLIAVDDPAGFFLTERREYVAGSAVTVSMEGTRPFLIEAQALVTQSSYGTPQRSANGIDYRRFVMLVAVLEKRAGLPLRTQDVFINLAGGFKIDETGIDLGVTVAVASSFKDVPLEPKAAFIGEVGLVGEVRSVPFLENRVREALKFGFTTVYVPKSGIKILEKSLQSKVTGIESLNQLFGFIF
ncbi:MAG TPA: DNA repair protein RadA [Candidatus Marinimicrobia bacterium]|nr:DNA repair protein RadA [Candidatus Neomarinimicrobiota bacterium]